MIREVSCPQSLWDRSLKPVEKIDIPAMGLLQLVKNGDMIVE
jgi:hypothetical protein